MPATVDKQERKIDAAVGRHNKRVKDYDQRMEKAKASAYALAQ